MPRGWAVTVEVPTTDGTGNGGTITEGVWRKYNSYEEAWAHRAEILQYSFYARAQEYKSQPYLFAAMIWGGNGPTGYATDPYYVEKVCGRMYTLETGKPATMDVRSTTVSKQGTAVDEIEPTGEFLEFMRQKVYNNPTVMAAIHQRHHALYSQSGFDQYGKLNWDYPNRVWEGGQWVTIAP